VDFTWKIATGWQRGLDEAKAATEEAKAGAFAYFNYSM
jgi:hypothetical protein